MKGGWKQEWRQLLYGSAEILDEGSKNGHVFKKVIKQVLFSVNTLVIQAAVFAAKGFSWSHDDTFTFTFLSSATVILGLSIIKISFFFWEAPVEFCKLWRATNAAPQMLGSAAVPVPLTWVCCCKRDAVLGVERGLVLRGERKPDEKRTPAAERGRRRRPSPWSSLDHCLEWRCWPERRRGLDPSHSTATPQVSEASAWRPWRGRIGKHLCRVSSVLKRKRVGGAEDPHLLQVASRRMVSILWISSSICALPLSFHSSSRTEPVSCEFTTRFQDFAQPQSRRARVKLRNLEQFDGADEICVDRMAEQGVHEVIEGRQQDMSSIWRPLCTLHLKKK